MLVAKESRGAYYSPAQKRGIGYVPEPGRYEMPAPGSGKVTLPRESKPLCWLLLCLIIIGVGMISQYGRTIAGNYQLEKTRREIIALQEEKECLRVEVNRLSALERIETIAIDELGLQYPKQSQWLVLSARGN